MAIEMHFSLMCRDNGVKDGAKLSESKKTTGRNENMVRIISVFALGAMAIAAPVVLAQTSGQPGVQGSASGNAEANGKASASKQSGSLAAGTAVNADVNQAVDSKKAKEGDAITAHTTEAVKSGGKVVIPKGTKLVGHVTRAKAKAKGDAESTLAVQFDRAILKDGQTIPLQVTIQALASGEPAAAVSGDDLQGMGSMGGGASASGSAAGRGAIGGVTSTVGGAASGAASTVPRTTQDATGAVNSTVSGAATTAGRTGASAGTGLNATGQLASTSRGVFGLNGLSLNANAGNSAEGSVITSTGKNVRLDSGTKMLLVAQAGTSASAQR
jgi:hypothetical protein